MAATLNLHKAVRKIRLDDSEGSPEFVLDLTDQAIVEKAAVYAGCAAVYSKAVKDMEEQGLTDEVRQRLMSAYHVTVDAFLGEGAFDTITAWLCDGEGVPPEQMTAVYAPLMVYLYEEYNAVLTVNRNKAAERYFTGLRSVSNPL